jgi:hypothetical protein
MKPLSTLSFFIGAFIFMILATPKVQAQQYKLRQVTAMSGMKSETTIYVKGKRKRTEGGGYAGMNNNIVTIEQCDLQRTIKFNDKKKLYIIQPFNKEEDNNDDVKPAAVKNKPVVKEKTEIKNGGTIYMYYNITDTGERKKMYGFTARHIWTTQKMKPSADACTMKDSMLIKTDGWYIDFPEFNCDVSYGGANGGMGGNYKPECRDKFVSKRSGKGKLGFALIETKTMIMGGNIQTSEFKTSLETLELSTAKLDSMLFEIPLGYTQTNNEEDLQDKMDVSSYIKQSSASASMDSKEPPVLTEEKKAGMTRIAVYEPKGEESLQLSQLQKHLVASLNEDKIEAVAVGSEAEAKKYNCDLLLTTEFVQVKKGSKVGGILKAIKNADPGATSSYNIETNLTLSTLSNGSTRLQKQVSGKFEGQPDEAAKKALDKGSKLLLKELR